MAYTFPDGGLTVVPTGSIGISFKTTAGMPAEIALRATNSDSVVTDFTDLAIISDGSTDYNYVELTPPLALGDVYDVAVLFDSVQVHTETVEVPLPGKNRSRVLRQRIYEVALAGYLSNAVAAAPYGNGHYPSSVTQSVKPKGGIIAEVGAAYITDLSRYSGTHQTATVAVPVNVYGGIDESEDTEEIATAFEELAGYLMASDWKLAGFGIIQSGATHSGNQPEINDDRKMAVVRGTVNVSVRARI